MESKLFGNEAESKADSGEPRIWCKHAGDQYWYPSLEFKMFPQSIDVCLKKLP